MSQLDVIERDIEASRARLEVTIDALQARLTPAAIAGQAAGLAGRAPAHGLAAHIGSLTRRKPVVSLLIGAGIGMLAYQALRPRATSRGAAERDAAVLRAAHDNHERQRRQT